jgi:hypothetical protein
MKPIEDMTEPELRELMTGVANSVKARLPAGSRFCVLVWGPDQIAQYVSNCRREDMAKALRETAVRIAGREDVTRAPQAPASSHPPSNGFGFLDATESHREALKRLAPVLSVRPDSLGCAGMLVPLHKSTYAGAPAAIYRCASCGDLLLMDGEGYVIWIEHAGR